jgi:hypothetical protein
MRHFGENFFRTSLRIGVRAGMGGLLSIGFLLAQTVPYARNYQKSREEVEATLKEMQAYSGQRLPIVEGFVASGDKTLDQFERAFCQFSIELVPGTSGGTIVQVTAKITAWYADRDPSKSGYQVLPSNGRIELDLLDRLDEKLSDKHASSIARSLSNSTITAPKPKLDPGGVPIAPNPSSANASEISGATRTSELNALRAKREAEEKRMRELSADLHNLRDIQKNQAHPLNLVVVKKMGSPVRAKPTEGARVLFNAAAEDEFEFIDAEGEWVHVQISGPSRGYIRRANLELPELIAERLKSPNAPGVVEKSSPFRIEREENSIFPGHWELLKGRTVRIFTVQPISQDRKETGARAKLEYASAVFQKSAMEAASSTLAVEGIVVIFDSADGGILGATLASVKDFAAGTLSSDNFWKHCYFDPPEAFQESRKP